MPRVKKETSPEKRKNRRHQAKSLNPEIIRGIGVIALFLAAGILILSFFGLGGSAGTWIDLILAKLLGESRFLAPVLLLLMGVLIEWQKDYPHDSRHLLGLILLLFGVNGLVHLDVPAIEAWKIALAGQAGGLVGFAASFPLQYLFGFWVTLAILLALILAALLLLLNTSLARLLNAQRLVLLKLGTLGKIIVGVISLFIKKTPLVAGYDKETEEEQSSFSFRRQALKKEEDEAASASLENGETLVASALTEEMDKPTRLTKKSDYRLPPIDLLTQIKSQPMAGDIKANTYTIQKTLENFGISVEMGEVRVGPTVAQYTLKPADGVKLASITGLHNDLAMALAAHPIRIEAPIPGRSLVGVEVPNQKVAIVSLREILESKEWQELTNKAPLVVTLGKDVAGKPWCASLSSLPHLLIAGTTGSGKTVCINALLLSLLFQHTPDTLRLILVDPKRVELPLYNGIPHLLTPVITDVRKIINALKWTIGEMERRFELLSKTSRRDIVSYNRVMEKKIPYIVFVIDELADLMVTAGAEVEAGIIRLAQMSRAVGIHLVLATQRPSVDIITGLIKANIPARIAFSVASLTDSRTILDIGGAEKLLGRGDMLWSPPDMSKPKRLQGAYIGDEETKRVVEFLKGEDAPQYNDEIVAKQQSTFIFNGAETASEDNDPLLDEAKNVILLAGKASASLLQRRLKVGYARAARLLDLLEEQGFIGPSDGAKPREILSNTIPVPVYPDVNIDVEKILEDESNKL